MTKLIKNNKTLNLKAKIVNSFMISGKKKTVEKISLKFAKSLQKLTNKNFKKLVQLAIINITPTFKVNEQIVKKGKRKTIKSIPSFITSNSLRIMLSLKLFRKIVSKSKRSSNFYEGLAHEILDSAFLKSQSIDKKNEVQKQVLLNKRYLSKFRW